VTSEPLSRPLLIPLQLKLASVLAFAWGLIQVVNGVLFAWTRVVAGAPFFWMAVFILLSLFLCVGAVGIWRRSQLAWLAVGSSGLQAILILLFAHVRFSLGLVMNVAIVVLTLAYWRQPGPRVTVAPN